MITDKGMNAKPTAADQWLRDSLGRGCGVFEGRITPGGARVFYFRYSDPGGARVRLQVGAYSKDGSGGGLTLSDARTRAAEWSLMYQRGARDLRGHFEREQAAQMAAADREATRHAAEVRAVEAAELATSRRITVRQLFERWAVTDLTPRVLANGKRTGRKDGGKYSREQFERRIFPTLGNVAAEDVRKGDVLAILDAVKAEGKLRTCNVLLTDMKQLMRFAVSRDILLHSPLETVTKRHAGGAETERERVLSANDVTTLARALPEAGLHKRSALALWVILATGCRVGELMGAQWMHVDTVGRAWHLPVTKNERSHIIHLSAFAVRQFEALAALHEVDPVTGEGLPWVFPDTSRKAARGSVCVKSFGKQLADRQRPANKPMKNRSKATEALILPGGKWTAHDLRRTTATLMAGIGVSGDVIDECLNHVIESRVRRTYIRDRRPVEQARAFDALGAKLDALVNGAAV